jgi:hypothetical protein
MLLSSAGVSSGLRKSRAGASVPALKHDSVDLREWLLPPIDVGLERAEVES